jgi:hypothetical protein
MIDKRLERIMEIRNELFDIANSYAGDETGVIASELHRSCNCILRANKMATEGISPLDEERQFSEWLFKL